APGVDQVRILEQGDSRLIRHEVDLLIMVEAVLLLRFAVIRSSRRRRAEKGDEHCQSQTIQMIQLSIHVPSYFVAIQLLTCSRLRQVPSVSDRTLRAKEFDRPFWPDSTTGPLRWR